MPLKKKKTIKRAAKKKIVRKKKVSPKKKTIKKTSKKRVLARKAGESIIGKVTHYFPKVRVAVIKLKAPLEINDTIKIKGHTTDFTQAITSMQIDHVPVEAAKKGQEIGLLVNSLVREHDTAYKVK